MAASQVLRSLVLTIACFACVSCHPHPSRTSSVPTFADVYYADGILMLPYAEIAEPFTAYYDKPNRRSRIDYYGDLVQTIQRADVEESGVSYKVAYMPSEKDGKPVHTCFVVNGSQEQPVAIQSVLPDLTGFSLLRNDPCPPHGQGECERWEETVKNGKKVNRYIMWIKRDKDGNPIPVKYTMKGYDSLFGSHYDKYEMYYVQYQPSTFSEDVFHVSENLTCRDFPGPGAESLALQNPMHEFVNRYDDHITNAFEDFKSKHGKTYSDDTDHERRKNIFRQNFRFIHSTNRGSKTFQLAVNHLADFTDEEMRILRGRLPSGNEYNGGQPFDKNAYKRELPESLDWRLYGAVTPVKDQAVCGSCWSFGTTGTIEGAYFLKTGQLVKLSEQQLIDCSWNDQNNGCDGGEDFRAYKYIQKVGGLASTEDYGAYLGQDGMCHDHATPKTVQIVDYVNVTSGDAEALKIALFNHGPISVSIDASHRTFSFYANGVYYEPACGNTPDELDHSVLAVGYGVLNGEPYWLIKNSWSTYWGNDGYVLMSQKDNNCGVTTAPTFVRL